MKTRWSGFNSLNLVPRRHVRGLGPFSKNSIVNYHSIADHFESFVASLHYGRTSGRADGRADGRILKEKGRRMPFDSVIKNDAISRSFISFYHF